MSISPLIVYATSELLFPKWALVAAVSPGSVLETRSLGPAAPLLKQTGAGPTVRTLMSPPGEPGIHQFENQ